MPMAEGALQTRNYICVQTKTGGMIAVAAGYFRANESALHTVTERLFETTMQ